MTWTSQTSIDII